MARLVIPRSGPRLVEGTAIEIAARPLGLGMPLLLGEHVTLCHIGDQVHTGVVEAIHGRWPHERYRIAVGAPTASGRADQGDLVVLEMLCALRRAEGDCGERCHSCRIVAERPAAWAAAVGEAGCLAEDSELEGDLVAEV